MVVDTVRLVWELFQATLRSPGRLEDLKWMALAVWEPEGKNQEFRQSVLGWEESDRMDEEV